MYHIFHCFNGWLEKNNNGKSQRKYRLFCKHDGIAINICSRFFPIFYVQFNNFCIYDVRRHDFPYIGLCRSNKKDILSILCAAVLCFIRHTNAHSQTPEPWLRDKCKNGVCSIHNRRNGLKCFCFTHCFGTYWSGKLTLPPTEVGLVVFQNYVMVY